MEGRRVKTVVLNAVRSVFKFPPLEIALARITNGAAYPGPVASIPPNNYQYARGSVRRVTRDGLSYELDISDLVDWYTYFGFRNDSLSALYRLTREGAVVVDVGANNGLVTLNLAKRAGSSGRVISFEPDRDTFGRLERNVALNGARNVTLENIALGRAKGKARWITPRQDNAGMNRMAGGPGVNDVDDVADASREVDVTTLDHYFENRPIERLDLIKIDVEGREADVIAGAELTLARFQPVLFVELSDTQLGIAGSSASELLRRLERAGYTSAHSEGGRRISSSSDFTSPASSDYCGGTVYYDIVAYPARHAHSGPS
jgi:FkbM family methyltransferase